MKTFTLSSEGVLARYDYLSRLSPDRWAWEYARRNPDLRRDAEAVSYTHLTLPTNREV